MVNPLFFCSYVPIKNIFLLMVFISTRFNKIIKYTKKGENMIEEMMKYSAVDSSINKLLHEIKNPLTVCNGYLDMCLKNNKDSNKKYLSIVRDELKRTLNIISEFKRSDKDTKLDLKEFDILTLLKDVKSILDSLYLEKRTEIQIINNEKVYIEGDYNKLKQAFINILKNSLESKDKKYLKIKVKIEKLKEYIKITITDNGCGMSCYEIDHIYDEYYTTKDTGTGLGVPLIKEIINSHNGMISYKSKEKIGTTITIKLPYKKSPKTFNKSN